MELLEELVKKEFITEEESKIAEKAYYQLKHDEPTDISQLPRYLNFVVREAYLKYKNIMKKEISDKRAYYRVQDRIKQESERLYYELIESKLPNIEFAKRSLISRLFHQEMEDQLGHYRRGETVDLNKAYDYLTRYNLLNQNFLNQREMIDYKISKEIYNDSFSIFVHQVKKNKRIKIPKKVWKVVKNPKTIYFDLTNTTDVVEQYHDERRKQLAYFDISKTLFKLYKVYHNKRILEDAQYIASKITLSSDDKTIERHKSAIFQIMGKW